MTRTAPATVSVDSTLLASVTYDIAASLLRVGFCNGAIYEYFAVPEFIHQGLLAADSKGVYFNSQIRSRFRYTCLRRPE
jgi:KTSC domain